MEAQAANVAAAARNKAIVAGVIGHVVEWYDFFAYSFLATTIAVVFPHPRTPRPHCWRPSRSSARRNAGRLVATASCGVPNV
jgi:hypothetical protein